MNKLQFLRLGALLALFFIGAAPASAVSLSSGDIAVDTRDYTVEVISEHGSPTPAVGTHASYAWRSKLTLDAGTDPDWTSTGWIGTGSVPASGNTSSTGEITLNEVDSSITWQWEAVDSDGDGLGDAWETQYFGNLDQVASGDFDGDGRSNGQEETNGTDPTNPLTLISNLSKGFNSSILSAHGDSLYIIGGLVDGSSVGSARIYEFDRQSLLLSETSASLPYGMGWSLSGAIGSDGKTYLGPARGPNSSNGWGYRSKIVEFDPLVPQAFELTAGYPTRTWGIGAASDETGIVYFFGGHTGSDLRSIYRFDPSVGVLEAAGQLPFSTDDAYAISNRLGQIYVIDTENRKLLRYDPEDNSVAVLVDLPDDYTRASSSNLAWVNRLGECYFVLRNSSTNSLKLFKYSEPIIGSSGIIEESGIDLPSNLIGGCSLQLGDDVFILSGYTAEAGGSSVYHLGLKSMFAEQSPSFDIGMVIGDTSNPANNFQIMPMSDGTLFGIYNAYSRNDSWFLLDENLSLLESPALLYNGGQRVSTMGYAPDGAYITSNVSSGGRDPVHSLRYTSGDKSVSYVGNVSSYPNSAFSDTGGYVTHRMSDGVVYQTINWRDYNWTDPRSSIYIRYSTDEAASWSAWQQMPRIGNEGPAGRDHLVSSGSRLFCIATPKWTNNKVVINEYDTESKAWSETIEVFASEDTANRYAHLSVNHVTGKLAIVFTENGQCYVTYSSLTDITSWSVPELISSLSDISYLSGSNYRIGAFDNKAHNLVTLNNSSWSRVLKWDGDSIWNEFSLSTGVPDPANSEVHLAGARGKGYAAYIFSKGADGSVAASELLFSAKNVNKAVYTITTIAGPNGTISPENPEVVQGTDQTFTITPSVGYEIDVLTVDGEVQTLSFVQPLTNVQAPRTIEATFALKTYTVNFLIGEDGIRSSGGALSQTVAHGGTAEAPILTPPPGYDFVRWNLPLGPITADRTITAEYQRSSNKWHTVIFEEGLHGSRIGGGELVQEVQHAEPAVAPVMEADTGWSFIGWSASFGAVLSNLRIEAIYDRDSNYKQLTVISPYGSPSVTGLVMISNDEATTVTMPEMEITLSGAIHTCTGWSASDGSSGAGDSATLPMTEDVTLTWHWESQYYLDVTTEGPGTVDEPAGYHAAGSEVTLTATPEGDNEFQGWSGSASGMDATITLTMDEPKSVTAKFGPHVVLAQIDSLAPLRTVLDAPVTFSGSGAASGGAEIVDYRWQMKELVDGVEPGTFVELSEQASFITTSLPAGHWRVHFDVRDTTGEWSDPVTGDIRIEDPAGLTDLAVTRTDLRFVAEDGSELDPMIANQVRFGDAVTVEITVRNLGGLTVETPVDVALYDGKGPADLTAYTNVGPLLGTAAIDTPLPAGGAITAAIDWQVGYDFEGNALTDYDGSFRLLSAVVEHQANQVEATDGDSEELPIYEASLENNKAQATLLVGAVPLEDYTMEVTLNNASVWEDERAVLSGQARYVWLDNEDEVVGATVQVVVNGKTYYTTTDARGQFSVSADYLPDGSYPMTVEVSDSTLLATDSATLTVRPRLVPPAPRPDLRVLDLEVATTSPGSYETESTMPHVLRNREVIFAATIYNQGKLGVSAPFELSFTVDGTSEVIATVLVEEPLAVGERREIYTTGTPWSSDTVGNYTIRATVDSGSAITELEEGNNTRGLTIAVHEGRPDLRPYFISGVVVPTLTVSPANPVQGETLTLGVEVYNAGPVDLAETTFKVNFLINGQPIASENVTAALNSGGSVHVEVPWDTSNEQPGYKDLLVVVDADDVVLEDFENNNIAEATFELAPAAPQLVITQTAEEAFWYSQTTSLLVGQTLDFDVVIKNIGGADYTGGSFLQLTEETISSPQKDVAAIPSMGVDRSRTVRVSWTAPETTGSVTLLLSVNGSVVSKRVVVYERGSPLPPQEPYADPAVASADITIAESEWGENEPKLVQAGVTIRNRGTKDAGNLLVQFEYSVDSVGYTPLGLSQTIESLAVGASVPLESTGSFEAVEPYYSVRVRITSLDAGNRGFNDVATRSFAVDAPWADAGPDQISVVGRTVSLNGSASLDASGYIWEISAMPVGSTALLVDANTVTPSFEPDLPGSYELQLQVTDGALYSPYDWVTILVNDQLGTTLTVASEFGQPSPAVGSHPVTIGGTQSIAVSDVIAGGVWRDCIGWSGSGIDPLSGSAESGTITVIDELPTLTWEWRTQYLIEVATAGDGTVDGDRDWLVEGETTALVAQAATGYEFHQWVGDLSGSTIEGADGATVQIPVDQPRVIEAQFRPVPVTGLDAQVSSFESVELSWTYGGLPEALFRIERLSDVNGVWQTLATVDALSYVDNTVFEGQSLSYRVYAVVGGLDSASADAQIEVPYLPDVPAGLELEAVSIAEVVASWQPAARATSYALQRRLLPLGDWEVLGNLAGTTWSDTAVAEGARYAYRVQAVNASGKSGFSAPVEVAVPVDGGDWTYGLQVDNVTASSNVLCGAPIEASMDVLLSNPAGDSTRHRVVVGLRDVDGVAVGTPIELIELAGIPSYPPEWTVGIQLPEGLRLPAQPGTYTLWIEDVLIGGDPREAFAAVVRTRESDLAKQLAIFDAVLPEQGDAFVEIGDISAMAGEFVDLPINVGAIGGENAFSFSLSYDPSLLEFDSLKASGGMGGGYIDANDSVPGELGALMLLPAGVGLDAGIQEIARARFRIADTASGEVPVLFSDQPTFRFVVDPLAQILPHVWYDGSVSVMAAGYEADVSPRGNPNGVVNESDALQIRAFILGHETIASEAEFQRVDCAPIATRGDGKVNLLDAVVAGRYAAGFEVLKDVGGPVAPETIASPMRFAAFSEQVVQGLGAGDSGLIRLDASSGTRGEILEVPVSISSGGNVEAFSFSISFDPNELSFLDATPAILPEGGLGALNADDASAGMLAYVYRMPEGVPLDAGEVVVLTLKFRVSEGASDVVMPIQVVSQPADLVLSDRFGNEITSTGQGANVQLLPSSVAGTPEAVSDLAVSLEDDTRVRLEWTDLDGETSYRLYRRNNREAWSLIASLPANAASYVDAGLEQGISYAYRLGAVNAAGESVSDFVSFEVPSAFRRWADLRMGVGVGERLEDSDGDGLWNELEFLMGLDPSRNDANAMQVGSETIYDFVGEFLTLTLEFEADASDAAILVETASDLHGNWVESPRIEAGEINGKRQLKFRSANPMNAEGSQFMRIRSR